MASDPESIAVCFNIYMQRFSAERAMAVIKDLASDGRVWNFIPGLYLFKSRTDPLHEKINDTLSREGLDGYIVFKFDHNTIEGQVPEEAWDAFWFNVFRSNLEQLIQRRGWSEEVRVGLLAAADEYNAKKD